MTSYNIFLIFILLSWSCLFHCFSIKLKLISHYPTYITCRVSNVIRFGPGDALMSFVSVYPVWRSRLARVAHNHEVIRSKRIAGIYHHFAVSLCLPHNPPFRVFRTANAVYTALFNRHGVIGNTWFTLGSKLQDRCLLSVYLSLDCLQNSPVNRYVTLN